MSVLLDSNICIAAMNSRPRAVLERLAQLIASETAVCISSIVSFELWYGVAKSVHVTRNTDALTRFLVPIHVIDFDSDDAKVAADIRQDLEAAGRPIGSYDYLITAQALRRDFLLITANVGEFSRVKGLRWENWLA